MRWSLRQKRKTQSMTRNLIGVLDEVGVDLGIGLVAKDGNENGRVHDHYGSPRSS